MRIASVRRGRSTAHIHIFHVTRLTRAVSHATHILFLAGGRIATVHVVLHRWHRVVIHITVIHTRHRAHSIACRWRCSAIDGWLATVLGMLIVLSPRGRKYDARNNSRYPLNFHSRHHHCFV